MNIFIGFLLHLDCFCGVFWVVVMCFRGAVCWVGGRGFPVAWAMADRTHLQQIEVISGRLKALASSAHTDRWCCQPDVVRGLSEQRIVFIELLVNNMNNNQMK